MDNKCPECKAKNVYYRSRTKDFQCRACGNTFKAKKKSDRQVAK